MLHVSTTVTQQYLDHVSVMKIKHYCGGGVGARAEARCDSNVPVAGGRGEGGSACFTVDAGGRRQGPPPRH